MSRFPAAHAASVGAAAARTIEPFAVVNATHDATVRSHALRIRLPGSKSLTNRHLVLAALAEGTTELRGILHSDDCDRLQFALMLMGAQFKEKGDLLQVKGVAGRPNAVELLNLGEGGTPTRFMLAVAALADGETEVDASARMRERPIGEGVSMLQALGAQATSSGAAGSLPVRVRGVMTGGSIEVGRTASSQFVSALMLVAAHCARGIDLHFTETPTSASYLALSYDALRQAGIEASLAFGPTIVGAAHAASQWNGLARITIAPARVKGYRAVIEPDASSAVYIAALAALIGVPIELTDLPRRGAQPDFAFLSDLELRGARVEEVKTADGGVATRVTRQHALRARDADYSAAPDAAVMAMVLAGLCDGPSLFTGLATLRVKESDRIESVAAGLRALGGQVDTGPDWARVYPLPLQLTPATISSANDHRIAMSFAVLGCARAGVTIADPAVVSKSWPSFWTALDLLRTEVVRQNGAPSSSKEQKAE